MVWKVEVGGCYVERLEGAVVVRGNEVDKFEGQGEEGKGLEKLLMMGLLSLLLGWRLGSWC